MPRRRKKEPSFEGFIVAVFVLAFVWVKISRITLQSILSTVFWLVLFLIFIAVVFVFFRALYKSTQPKERKLQQSKSSKGVQPESSGFTVLGSAEEELKWSEALTFFNFHLKRTEAFP